MTDACVGGKCVTPLAAPGAADLPDGTGLFNNVLRTMGDALRIVYYDHAQGDLKLAAQGADGKWAVTFVDGNDPATDVGQFASARLEDDGTLQVAYQDAITDQLLYKRGMAAALAMAPAELIDDGVRPDGRHSVGAGASLYLANGQPRVVYQDQALSDVLSATRGSSWSHAPAFAGPAGYGWWPHLVADGDKLWVTQYVYDRAAARFGALTITPLPQ
jgi:hypothetical protein